MAGPPPNRLSEVSSYFSSLDDVNLDISKNGNRQRHVPSNNNSYADKVSMNASGPRSSYPPTDLTSNPESVNLKKRVSLVSGIALIVGTVIGSGIFISPTGVVRGSGSVGLSLVSWVICGIISLLGALTYAELGTLIPKSGGEYTYLLEAYGPLKPDYTAIPAYLFAWTMMTLLRPASVSIIALAFATYVLEPFYNVCDAADSSIKCLAAFLILVLTLINCFSVKLAVWLQNVLTIAKLVAIVIIIFGGFVQLGAGNTQYLNTGFTGEAFHAGRFAIGLYNGMWAYDGWNNLNYVTEEVVNPDKNIPRAIMIAIPLVMVLYVLVNISYFTVISASGLLQSPAVALTWGNRVLGAGAWVIPLTVAMSTAGAVNGTIFTTGRLTYVAAREGHMLELMSMVHVKRFTPLPSLIFTAFMSLIFIIPGDIESLIEFFNFAVWFFYGGTAAACIVMRFKTRYKEEHRPFKVPIVIPIIVVLIALFLVIAPIVDDPQIEFLYAFLFIVGGLIFYFPFVHFKIKPRCLDKFTCFLQLLLESALPSSPPVS